MDLNCKRCSSKKIMKIVGGWECKNCGYFDADNCPLCPDFNKQNVEQVFCNMHFNEWLTSIRKGY